MSSEIEERAGPRIAVTLRKVCLDQKARLERHVGQLDKVAMGQVDQGIKIGLGLEPV